MLFHQALYNVVFFSLFPFPQLLSVFSLTKTQKDEEHTLFLCPISGAELLQLSQILLI